MASMWRALADTLAASPLQASALAMLQSAAAIPPLIQTSHLLAVAMLMASAVVWQLRLSALAFPRQSLPEMRSRLLPWFWSGLLLLLLTGLPMLLARPYRYLLNPVFQIKILLLLLALLLSVLLWRRLQVLTGWWRLLPLVAVLLWLTTVLAGRWIAYADYLFWSEP